jgi:Protein of unknown function (DUF2815)
MSTQTAETAKPAKDPNVFLLKHVRLSYLNVWKKKAAKGQSEDSAKFSATAIFDVETQADQIKAIKAQIDHLIKTELKMNKLPADKICLRDGAEKDAEGYGEGTMYLAASNAKKPKVVGTDKKPLETDDPRLFSGVYGNMVVRLWVQNNDYGKRVNASLEAVQYVRTGEALGNQVDVDSILEEEEEESGGSLLD